MYASVQNWKLELRFFSRRMKWRLKKIVVILEYYRKCNFIEKKKQNKTKLTNDQNATRVCSKVKYLDQLRKKTRTVF